MRLGRDRGRKSSRLEVGELRGPRIELVSDAEYRHADCRTGLAAVRHQPEPFLAVAGLREHGDGHAVRAEGLTHSLAITTRAPQRLDPARERQARATRLFSHFSGAVGGSTRGAGSQISLGCRTAPMRVRRAVHMPGRRRESSETAIVALRAREGRSRRGLVF